MKPKYYENKHKIKDHEKDEEDLAKKVSEAIAHQKAI